MPLPAHGVLHDQSILQEDHSCGNTIIFESLQDYIYGFSAHFDLDSVKGAALATLLKDMANITSSRRMYS